ncbi:MAG: type II toxin-antitoxin system VapC family toxin [Alphaproteobacteria bacterium]|uniref:Ribonuclease VapC n=1 Tax=Candidatus Nitrobium versatile TaxID=2884831 RepID=A0A953SGR6_9BACT|nr:type II toxin-antitoxin system VapC family toxin [Candidatus Nitrobium versatile]
MPLILAVDASVLIKAYIPEVLSEKAGELFSRVQRNEVALAAPDLVYAEVGNILWKKYRLKELTAPDVEEISREILSFPLTVVPSKSILPLAIDFSIAYSITVYDALYVSTAILHGTKLVTADKKLTDTLQQTQVRENIIGLEGYC